MTLEQQTVSREIAQKLKELGVPQESYFFWAMNQQMEWELMEGSSAFKSFPGSFAAYTVAELGELLPKGYWDEASVSGGFEVGYSNGLPMGEAKIDRYFVIEPKEADARGKMLIYLLENKLITLP